MTAQNCLQQRGTCILISIERKREVEELKLIDFFRFNPTTNSWSPIVAMMSRRSGVSTHFKIRKNDF